MTPLGQIYVLIPAFNEARGLSDLLPRLPKSIEQHPVGPVVVSDGSTDGTAQVANRIGAEVLDLPRNRGKGAALKAGQALIAGRPYICVVLMDGDGQHDPGALPRLVAPVLAGECELAIGSRYLDDPTRGPTPLNRYLVRKVVILLLRRRLNQPLSDPFSGYRCFTRQAFNQVTFKGDHYQGELEARFDAAIRGLTVAEVPVPLIYQEQFSKMGSQGGPLRGRLRVLGQYASVIARKSREFGSSRDGSERTRSLR